MPSSKSAVVAAGRTSSSIWSRCSADSTADRMRFCSLPTRRSPSAEAPSMSTRSFSGLGAGRCRSAVVTATSALMILDSSWARSAAVRRSARCCSLLRRRSAASASDCSARASLICRAASSFAYPAARVCQRLASLPAVSASFSLRSASRSLLLRVEALDVLAAACRALAASARFADSFDRYSPAFLSASMRCLRLRSSWLRY